MRRHLFSFACGALMGVGLLLAGVTDPATVFAGFSPGPDWDPRVMLMFLASIAVHAPMRAAVSRAAHAIDGTSVGPPAHRLVGPRLVVGATIFGVGWGLGGICPGPGITGLGGGAPAAWLFAAGFVAGLVLYERWTPALDSVRRRLRLRLP